MYSEEVSLNEPVTNKKYASAFNAVVVKVQIESVGLSCLLLNVRTLKSMILFVIECIYGMNDTVCNSMYLCVYVCQ